MQISNLALLSLFSALAANAAPVVVTVTEFQTTTVIVAGETQNINSAPVFTQPPTTDAPTTTADAATANPDFILNVDPTTTAEVPTTTAEAPATTTEAPVTTPAPQPTTLETSTNVPETTEAATTQAATLQGKSSDFQSQILAEHNAKRSLHGVDSLSWDSTLAQYAQNFADQYDCSGSLSHSGGPYGENLALGYTTTGSVDAWYSEGDNYNYGSTCSVYDHFTQVVWKSTTKVGCGYKQCDSYWGTYIVCSYDPAGNYIGECDSNVLPLV